MDSYKKPHLLYVHNSSLDSTKANLLQVISMCNAFQRIGVDVELYLPESKTKAINSVSYFKEKFGSDPLFDLAFYKTRFSNPKLNKYFSQKSIWNILKNSSAEFVFLRRHNFIDIALKSNKKVIFESHNSLLHNKKMIIEKYFKHKLIKHSECANFKLFISISENLKNYWIKNHIPPGKTIALHDGFDKQQFDKPISTTEARNILGLPKNKKIVTYVGSLYPDRGIENIIQLSARIPEAYFCVIGGPEQRKQYYLNISNAKNINNIVFFGSVTHSRVPLYLYASDVLLALWTENVPTINYCSPLKIFEYMASGKNIVAHDFKPIKEVLTNNYSALLVDYRSFDNLLYQVKQALALENNILGINAKKEAFNNYTWEMRAKAIIKKLNS